MISGILGFLGRLFRRRSDRSEPPAEPSTEWLTELTAHQSPAARAQPDLPEKDNWEVAWGEDFEDEVKIEIDALIHYRDGAGQESRRSIRTKRISPYGADLVISAHCNARQAHRTFLASRILEFTDLSTGEVVTDVRSHLRRAYETSPLALASSLIDSSRHEVDILLYVGRASGRLTPKKRDIVLNYLTSDDADRSSLREPLTKIFATESPTQAQFRAALKVVAASNQPPDGIVAAIDKLAGSGKSPDEFTTAAATYARKRLVQTAKQGSPR